MSLNAVYPRELEQQQMHHRQYCRGCILFLKCVSQQDPLLVNQAGVSPSVYDHPVLILATGVRGITPKCVSVAVITSRGGHDPPAKLAHEYLPIWPKAVTSSDAPQLFLGEGRTLPKESFVCLSKTFELDYSMLSSLLDSVDSYFFHLTRKSFNIVAERLRCPPMKLLDDATSPEAMIVPPTGVHYNLRRTANMGKTPIPVPTIILRDGETVTSISSKVRQPVPLSPPSQVNLNPRSPSLTPGSVHDLTQRLQTLSPPEMTKETHHTNKAKQPSSKHTSTTLRCLEHARRPSREPRRTPMIFFYDFFVLALVLLARAMWFFLKVFVMILTYMIIAWLLEGLASRITRTVHVWMNEIKAATEERLQSLAAEAKKTAKEVLDQL